MQFSTIIAAVSAISLAVANPVPEMAQRRDGGLSVGACETNVAAQQTACLATCSDPVCYYNCGVSYIAAYKACAGA